MLVDRCTQEQVDHDDGCEWYEEGVDEVDGWKKRGSADCVPRPANMTYGRRPAQPRRTDTRCLGRRWRTCGGTGRPGTGSTAAGHQQQSSHHCQVSVRATYSHQQVGRHQQGKSHVVGGRKTSVATNMLVCRARKLFLSSLWNTCRPEAGNRAQEASAITAIRGRGPWRHGEKSPSAEGRRS